VPILSAGGELRDQRGQQRLQHVEGDEEQQQDHHRGQRIVEEGQAGLRQPDAGHGGQEDLLQSALLRDDHSGTITASAASRTGGQV
jgi:hypothetical protein